MEDCAAHRGLSRLLQLIPRLAASDCTARGPYSCTRLATDASLAPTCHPPGSFPLEVLVSQACLRALLASLVMCVHGTLHLGHPAEPSPWVLYARAHFERRLCCNVQLLPSLFRLLRLRADEPCSVDAGWDAGCASSAIGWP